MICRYHWKAARLCISAQSACQKQSTEYIHLVQLVCVHVDLLLSLKRIKSWQYMCDWCIYRLTKVFRRSMHIIFKELALFHHNKKHSKIKNDSDFDWAWS